VRQSLSLSRGPSNWTTWTTGLFALFFIFSAVVGCRIFCSAVSTCLGKGKGSEAIRSRGLLPSNKAERRKTSKRLPDITRPEEMPERHNHGKNIIRTIRIQLRAKLVILQVYEVLARHN